MELVGARSVKKRTGRITWRGNVPPIPPHVTAYYETVPNAAYVYFAEDPETGLVKIGKTFAIHVMVRLRSLEREIGHPLTLLATTKGGFCVEREHHIALSHSRMRGEWFSPSPELSAFIDAANAPVRSAGEAYWGKWAALL